jgi:hypothetical protein
MCLETNHAFQPARLALTMTRATFFPSSFSLTGYLPIYSSRCLPRSSMHPRKPQRILECIAPATLINSLAT